MKILLSDLHLAPFRAQKFESQKMNHIEALIQFFAKKFEDPQKEEKMLRRIRNVIEREGIQVGNFNGDFMESLRTERGMSTKEDLEKMRELRIKILKQLGLLWGWFNLGNHESGYDLPLATDPERGINKAAIDNFLLFINREELYHSFFMDGCKIIFIPYIFSEEKARDFDLNQMKREFLSKMTEDLKEDVAIMLFVHDPDSFDDKQLLSLIRANRSKIKFIFFGHYHSWINLFFMRIMSTIYSVKMYGVCRLVLNKIFLIVAKGDSRIVEELGKYFYKRRNIPRIIKELGAILIPAPSGTFGIGGGYMVLDIEKVTIKKHKL